MQEIKYYLYQDDEDGKVEWEVTREAYIAAERVNGFRSKFGPDEEATASWEVTRTTTIGGRTDPLV